MALAEKASGIVVSVAALLAPVVASFSNEMTVPVLGIGVTSIAGAALGTLAAIGYDNNPPRPGGRLAFRSVSTIIIASMLVGGVPALSGWTWTTPAAEGAITGLVALAVYYGLDPVKKWALAQLGDFRLSDFIPFLRKRAPTAQSPGQNGPSDEEAPKP